MNTMRICHIQFAYYPDQGNIDIYEYTKALSDLGNEVHVIVAGRKGEKLEEKINGVKVHRIFFSSLKKRNFKSLLFFFKALKKLKKYNINFDIVHVYMSLGSCIVPIFRNKKTKYILDIRSGGITSKIYSLLAKIIINIESIFFDDIIVLDKKLADKLFKNKKKVNIVPLGANFEKFKLGKNEKLRNKLDISKNHVVFIYTGSIYHTRDLRNIIYAFQKVNKIYNKTKLLFIGYGDDLKNLKNLTKSLNIEKNVIFTGYINYEKIPEYLNAADIAISYVPITPEYESQPPLKTVEYLASGLPTIATNTLGNKKFIKNGYNGILTNDDVNSLSDSMTKLIENEELREKFKKNSRDSVQEYDWKKIVENRLIPVYEKVLK